MPRRTKITVCVDSSIFLAEVFGNETQLTRVGAIDRYQGIFRFKKMHARDREKRGVPQDVRSHGADRTGLKGLYEEVSFDQG